MTILGIKEHIDNLISHITFTYNNKNCGIDPITRNERYDMWYGDKIHTAKSVEEVMNIKFFDGKSLSDIMDDIEELDY